MQFLFKKALCASAVALAVTSIPASAVAPGRVYDIDRDLDSILANRAQQRIDRAQSERRYIVKFRSQTGISSKQQRTSQVNILQKIGATEKLKIRGANASAVMMTASQAVAIEADPGVEYVEIDPKRFLMAESTPYGIGMVQANQVSDSLVSNRKVCIMDTGYSLGHEDLPSATVTGFSKPATGDWFNDGNGHGTHVSGTIAAIGGNGVGVVGVNPGDHLFIHMVKVFDDTGTWAFGSDLVDGVNECVAQGANVISMSLGGGASSATEQAAFDNAYANGVLSIAAAGNAGNSSLSYPASYSSIMSVAAVDSAKNVASFSQFNSQVEIAAPGVNVESTWKGNTYNTISGTSMATPHVAGVAALVWSYHTNCSAQNIRDALNATAEDRGAAGRDNFYGFGIVQAAAAKAYLDNGCDGGGTPPPPPPPGNNVLTNGVAVTGIAGATGSETNYTMDVPAGATALSFDMSGGTGDADMYVKFGSAPTTSSYDCRPYVAGNSESCPISSAQTGTYYVMIRGYSAYSGVSLVGSFTEATGGGGGGGAATFTNSNNVTIRDRRTSTSNIAVDRTGDSGTVSIDVDIKHTYRGDLKITLVSPTGSSVVLKNTNSSDSADNVLQTYSVNAAGVESSGTWKLQVYDAYRGDTGFIDSWSISFQ
ncbi:MAG TPA: peptidase S8 [Aeromonadales bacterium]|nr:peptidase S8 [Aeromonadales bacterium]